MTYWRSWIVPYADVRIENIQVPQHIAAGSNILRELSFTFRNLREDQGPVRIKLGNTQFFNGGFDPYQVASLTPPAVARPPEIPFSMPHENLSVDIPLIVECLITHVTWGGYEPRWDETDRRVLQLRVEPVFPDILVDPGSINFSKYQAVGMDLIRGFNFTIPNVEGHFAVLDKLGNPLDVILTDPMGVLHEGSEFDVLPGPYHLELQEVMPPNVAVETVKLAVEKWGGTLEEVAAVELETAPGLPAARFLPFETPQNLLPGESTTIHIPMRVESFSGKVRIEGALDEMEIGPGDYTVNFPINMPGDIFSRKLVLEVKGREGEWQPSDSTTLIIGQASPPPPADPERPKVALMFALLSPPIHLVPDQTATLAFSFAISGNLPAFPWTWYRQWTLYHEREAYENIVAHQGSSRCSTAHLAWRGDKWGCPIYCG